MFQNDPSTNTALVKSGIGVGGVTYSFFGLPFSEVAAILTSVFMLISIILTFPKIYDLHIKWREHRKRNKE